MVFLVLSSASSLEDFILAEDQGTRDGDQGKTLHYQAGSPTGFGRRREPRRRRQILAVSL